MKTEKITKFESSANTLKVGKRHSFMNDASKGPPDNKKFSFRNNPHNSIIQSAQSPPTKQSQNSISIQSQIKATPFIAQECTYFDEKEITPSKFKQRLSFPGQQYGENITNSKLDEPTEEFTDQKIDIKLQCLENKDANPIQSYCAPDPFVNCDPSELEKMVANIKMPIGKFNKSKFRKMYKGHVIQTLQSICLIKTLKCPTDDEISKKKLSFEMPKNSIYLIRN
jgi:hypothetical protein